MTRHAPNDTHLPSLEHLEPRLMMAAAPAILPGGLQAVVEVGQAAVDHQATVVPLTRSFENPVVIVNRVAARGPDPAVLVVSDVQAEQFTVRLVEAPDRDGIHTAESISYIVAEAGRWTTPEGAVLEVGQIQTDATVNGLGRIRDGSAGYHYCYAKPRFM